MIQAQPGGTIEPLLEDAPSGLLGTITIGVVDPPPNVAGTDEIEVAIAHTAEGISEGPSEERSDYTGSLTLPGDFPNGTYQVEWDNDGELRHEELIVRGPVVGDVAYTPTVEHVAALLRARTKDDVGNELNTFTEDTRPKASEVEELIRQAVADVVMRVGAEVPAELEDSARYVVTLRTAAEIERSYQPEQSTDSFSTFQSLRLSYEEALRTLVAAVQIRSLFKEPETDGAVS